MHARIPPKQHSPTSTYVYSSPMINNALLVVQYSFPAVRRHPGFFSFVLFRRLKSKGKNVFASDQCCYPRRETVSKTAMNKQKNCCCVAAALKPISSLVGSTIYVVVPNSQSRPRRCQAISAAQDPIDGTLAYIARGQCVLRILCRSAP